jgi:hypothetical protein
MAAQMPIAMIAFVIASGLFIVALVIVMHRRHRYQPNLPRTHVTGGVVRIVPINASIVG